MKREFYIGMAISVFNLFFYAIVLDLLFYSGIFNMLFGIDLVKVTGDARVSIGIVAVVIAIMVEVVSYRVIRCGVVADYKELGENKKIQL